MVAAAIASFEAAFPDDEFESDNPVDDEEALIEEAAAAADKLKASL